MRSVVHERMRSVVACETHRPIRMPGVAPGAGWPALRFVLNCDDACLNIVLADARREGARGAATA